MTNKTLNQIAEMKKQTIGVEVEMNNITREKAARLAAEYFGTGRYEDTAQPKRIQHLVSLGRATAANGNSKRT